MADIMIIGDKSYMQVADFKWCESQSNMHQNMWKSIVQVKNDDFDWY